MRWRTVGGANPGALDGFGRPVCWRWSCTAGPRPRPEATSSRPAPTSRSGPNPPEHLSRRGHGPASFPKSTRGSAASRLRDPRSVEEDPHDGRQGSPDETGRRPPLYRFDPPETGITKLRYTPSRSPPGRIAPEVGIKSGGPIPNPTEIQEVWDAPSIPSEPPGPSKPDRLDLRFRQPACPEKIPVPDLRASGRHVAVQTASASCGHGVGRRNTGAMETDPPPQAGGTACNADRGWARSRAVEGGRQVGSSPAGPTTTIRGSSGEAGPKTTVERNLVRRGTE